MKIKNHRFNVYRYQILPVDRYLQGLLFDNISSIEELLDKKNELMQAYLKALDKILVNDSDIIIKSLFDDEETILYKFAVNRSMVRETNVFTKEELSNWPSFLVLFWNKPDKQYLIVEDRKLAYRESDTIVKSIEKYLSTKLRDRQLTIRFESLFNEEDFWHIIENNIDRIKDINFELITPNMANISAVLSDELKDFAVSTNTTRTQLLIASDSEASLNISTNNKMINSLVKYSSEGGGNISIKIKGLYRRIHTSKTKKYFEIEEAEISRCTPDETVRLFKGFLQ